MSLPSSDSRPTIVMPTIRVEIFETVALGSSLILVSMTMIRFNKFLMQPDVFPHSAALTMLHMTTSMVILGSLCFARPQWFPGLVNANQNREQLVRCFLPLGVMFAVTLYTINQAYLYCSVTFLQFMKEANVGLGFIISWIVGLQSIDRVKTFVVLWIIISASTSVSGELRFHWVGFILQLTGQMCECVRAVVMEIILGGRGKSKMDPLSYTLLLAPSCMLSLFVLAAMTWDDRIPQQFANSWHFLVPNTFLAVALNIALATCLTKMSAMGFLICGVVKDIVIVIVSALFFGDVVTNRQLYAFSATLFGVWLWSSIQVYPKGAIKQGLQSLLIAPADDETAPTESTALTKPERRGPTQGLPAAALDA